jgi:hypothetical protein
MGAAVIIRILAAAMQAGGPKGVHMRAYNGGALRLKGFDEPVVIDLAGLSVVGNVTLLLDHDGSRPVGHVEKLDNNGKTLDVEGRISATGPDAKLVLDNAANAFPWQASIGAEPAALKRIRAGETINVNGQTFQGPVIVATKSTLREISFVAVGADASTAVKVAASMNLTPNEEKKDDLTAERARCKAIAAAAAKYPGDSIAQIQAQAIEENWTPDKAELAMLRAARPAPPHSHQNGRQQHGGEQDQVVEAALCRSLFNCSDKFIEAQYGERIAIAASAPTYRGLTVGSLLVNRIRAAGGSAPYGRLGNESIREAFRCDQQMIQAAASTISVPGILSNVANKKILELYQQMKSTWQTWCTIESNKDFKPTYRYRLQGNGTYEQVPNGGKLPHLNLTEQAYNGARLQTHGAMHNLTREDIINDDLGAFGMLPSILGLKALQQLEKEIYTALLANPSNFFSAGNGNYISGSTTNLSIDSLTLAEQKFLKQTDPQGMPILIAPTVLLVPPELSTTANVLTRATEIRDTTANTKYGVTNPHQNSFTPAVAPWLSLTGITNASATAWYLLANVPGIAVAEVAFLNGQQTPTVESAEGDFNELGMRFRSFHDWGIAMKDYRAGVMSKGAA